MKSRLTPPVIIIGMHRSGTSMIAQHLIALGAYMGRDLTVNAESRLFQGFNRHLLAAAEGRWSDVTLPIEKMRDPESARHMVAQLEEALFIQRQLSAFFDMGRRVKLALGLNLGPWGWKDPRNSITLPIWISVFPQAKVIHVIRNGVDVAISLFQRERDRDPLHPDYSERCLSLQNCFRLWEEYLQACWAHRGLVASGQYLEIRYEEMLRAPERELRGLLAFVDQKVSPRKLVRVANTVDRSRLTNDRHRGQYQDEIAGLPHSSLMAQLGYH